MTDQAKNIGEAAKASASTQTQSKVLVTQDNKIGSLKAMLEKVGPQLMASMLKKNVTKDYVVQVALTAIRSNPRLLECTEVSLIAAIFQSVQLGLRLDGVLGQAYIVPFRNKNKGVIEAQFMPGYRGYLELAWRSGKIVNIVSQVLCQNDYFEYEYGTNEHLTHRPARGDRGEVTHVYAYAKMTTAGFAMEVMSIADVERVRLLSKAAEDGPWVTHWDDMARKTAIRKISKSLPLSVEFATAMELDELVSAGRRQELSLTEDGVAYEGFTAQDAEKEVRGATISTVAEAKEEAPKKPEPATTTPAAVPSPEVEHSGTIVKEQPKPAAQADPRPVAQTASLATAAPKPSVGSGSGVIVGASKKEVLERVLSKSTTEVQFKAIKKSAKQFAQQGELTPEQADDIARQCDVKLAAIGK